MRRLVLCFCLLPVSEFILETKKKKRLDFLSMRTLSDRKILIMKSHRPTLGYLSWNGLITCECLSFFRIDLIILFITSIFLSHIQFFTNDKVKPARSTIEVARLPKNALFEIEAIAISVHSSMSKWYSSNSLNFILEHGNSLSIMSQMDTFFSREQIRCASWNNRKISNNKEKTNELTWTNETEQEIHLVTPPILVLHH